MFPRLAVGDPHRRPPLARLRDVLPTAVLRCLLAKPRMAHFHRGWALSDGKGQFVQGRAEPALCRLVELAGAGWPWRPTTLLALSATAAIAVALLPAAAARRSRR